MNEEIKEILDKLQEISNYSVIYNIKINSDESKILLDYITNLKQENENIKQTLHNITINGVEEENTSVLDLIKENERLKQFLFESVNNTNKAIEQIEIYRTRCKKAIEYIMSDLITEWDIKNDGCVSGSDLPADAITPILNILNGSDDK